MPHEIIPAPVKRCRLCGSQKLTRILSLGNQYVSDFVTSSGIHPRSPLEVVRCSACGLLQLKHTFPRASLYTHYWYRSGISPTMRTALSDVSSKAVSIAKPSAGEMVIDIGCNDGTLLRSYPKIGLKLVGFEPAANLIPDASKGTDWIFNDFFKASTFYKKFPREKAKIITCVAMFYDLDRPNDFVKDIVECIAPNGVWVIQQNYLGTMLEKNGFDNIGHEHLEYYSLNTMEKLMSRHDLEIFDVETNDVNGGSFRTYVAHRGAFDVQERVGQLRRKEEYMKLDSSKSYRSFAVRIRKIKSDLNKLVKSEVTGGKTVYVYGASNRGNTILQYCKLDHRLIRKATDANPDKWGRSTVGTGIPIISKEEARKDKPDYFLVLPHHFLEEIKKEEKQYLDAGGKLIVPLPEARVVS